MQSTAKHIGLFRRVYNFAPCGNIASSVMVCIGNTATMFAAKAFPFSFANPKTISTHLRSVGGWDNEQLYTFELSLVGQELTKLVKAPTVQFCFQCFTLWFCCLTDIAQIFNGNSLVFTYCFFYNLLCYVVVVYGNEPSLSTTKPFQEFFSSLRAFALNAGSYFRILLANLFKLVGVEISAIRQGAYVNLSKVATDKFFNIFYIILHYINRLKQVEFAFAVQQICFSFDVGKVIGVVTDEWHLQSTTNRPNGNNVIRFVGQDATIIRDRAKRLKSALNLPIQLISIGNLRNTPYNNLTAQLRNTLNRVVGSIVKFKLLKGFLFPCYIGNKIASPIRFFNRLKQTFSLFISWQQLYFQRKFHKANIQLFQVQENYLITKKAMGVVAYLAHFYEKQKLKICTEGGIAQNRC